MTEENSVREETTIKVGRCLTNDKKNGEVTKPMRRNQIFRFAFLLPCSMKLASGQNPQDKTEQNRTGQNPQQAQVECGHVWEFRTGNVAQILTCSGAMRNEFERKIPVSSLTVRVKGQ